MNPVTEIDKIRRLPWQIVAGVLNSIFSTLTFGSAIFVLFLSELGLPKSKIGFLLSLFPFAGLVAIVVGPLATRFGLKRTYITFYTARKFIYGLVLLVPWVLARYGLDTAFLFVAAIITLFALCRAIAETAIYPWMQEFIPKFVRGRFSAASNISSSLVAALAATGAGYVLHAHTGLRPYILLTTVGLVAGLLSMLAYAPVPGGAPNPAAAGSMAQGFGDMFQTLKDRKFRLFLGAVAFQTLSLQALSAFVPLFLTEQIGISGSAVMYIQIGAMAGQLLFTLLWGWAADRYGSRPVLHTGLWMCAAVPLLWGWAPRHTEWSQSVALLITMFQGISLMAVAIGGNQLLYNRIVPPERSMQYMSIWYAWVGLAGGLSPLLSGVLLDTMGILVADPYIPLFMLCLALLFAAYLVYERIPDEGEISSGRFMSMFLFGNPLSAMGSILLGSRARDEEQRVTNTQRLGEARSPLATPNLVAALSDPSYNVRLEAVLSIARQHPNEELIRGLAETLRREDPELSPEAAWALGRMGDPRAIEPLREGLQSIYPSIRTRSARALGALGDADSIPAMRLKLKEHSTDNERLAFAAALGALKVESALPEILALLHSTPQQNISARAELAMTVARMVDAEADFFRLWNALPEDPGTALAGALLDTRRKWKALFTPAKLSTREIRQCAELFATGDLSAATRRLTELLSRPMAALPPAHETILAECRKTLAGPDAPRMEYLALVLAVVQAAPDPEDPKKGDLP